MLPSCVEDVRASIDVDGDGDIRFPLPPFFPQNFHIFLIQTPVFFVGLAACSFALWQAPGCKIQDISLTWPFFLPNMTLFFPWFFRLCYIPFLFSKEEFVKNALKNKFIARLLKYDNWSRTKLKTLFETQTALEMLFLAKLLRKFPLLFAVPPTTNFNSIHLMFAMILIL